MNSHTCPADWSEGDRARYRAERERLLRERKAVVDAAEIERRKTEADGDDHFAKLVDEAVRKGKRAEVVANVAIVASADPPLDLFPPLPPALLYPADALGPLRGPAEAISRKCQVPLAMAAQSVLVVAALASQAHADVQLPFGQSRPLSLFLVTVAASGERKTTSDNEASWPIAKREKALRDEHLEAMTRWRAEHAAWAAQKREIEGARKTDVAQKRAALLALGPEPPQPMAPFLTTGDLTLEGLAKLWANAHPSLAVFTAEGGTFTGGHGMNEDNRLRTAAALSELWDGKPIKRIRAQDGATILPGRRLSLHVMVQPDAATTFLSNRVLRDQGLLSRVLVAAPESIAGTRLYREPEPSDLEAVRVFGARVLSVLETPPPLAPGARNQLRPLALPMSADAERYWKAHHDNIEQQCGKVGELAVIGDFAAKAAEHAARLAGVLTLLENIHAAEITADAMKCGIRLAEWYLSEALRMAQASRTDPGLLRAASLLDWSRARPEDTFQVRDVLRLGPPSLRTKTVAEEAVAILIDHRWVSKVSERPRTFRLHRGA